MQILKFTPIQKGHLTAEIDLLIPKWGNFIIRKIKIIEKDGGRFLSLPSMEYEKDGKKQFYSLNLFQEREMADKFQKMVFEAYDNHLQSLASKSEKADEKSN